MKYKKAIYKYQLVEEYSRNLHGDFGNNVGFDYFNIKDGSIYVSKGYAWDGASGPTIDSKNSLKGSLIHDCLYQGIRLGLISKDKKKIADKEFFHILIEDGMCPIRAFIWYFFLRCASPFTCRKIRDTDTTLEI